MDNYQVYSSAPPFHAAVQPNAHYSMPQLSPFESLVYYNSPQHFVASNASEIQSAPLHGNFGVVQANSQDCFDAGNLSQSYQSTGQSRHLDNSIGTYGQQRHKGYQNQRPKYNRNEQVNNEYTVGGYDEENAYMPNTELFSRKSQYQQGKSSANPSRDKNRSYHNRSNYKNRDRPEQDMPEREKRTSTNVRKDHQQSMLNPNAPSFNYTGSGFTDTSDTPQQTSESVKQKLPNPSRGSKNAKDKYSNNGDSRSAPVKSARQNQAPKPHKNYQPKFPKQGNQEEVENQREALIEHLSNNSYECMVCCDYIKRSDAVWSCKNCYHVFHLGCLKKWARTSMSADDGGSGGWRCPACQQVNQQFPSQYRCYCGKVRDPESTRFEVPHSCGEVCGRKRSANCSHPCNVLCHPGPCPPCLATVTKYCDCKRSKQTVKCGQSSSIKCTAKCEKTLNCGIHECQRVCHAAPCDPCSDEINLECFCGKKQKTVICGTSEAFSKSFSCGEICNRCLDCGNHFCTKTCHAGSCDGCELMPAAVSHCPCGKTALVDIAATEARTKCTDPIPACESVCGKKLKCGSKDEPHMCRKPCHTGPCGVCEGEMEVTCRCGRFTKDMSCQEASKYTADDPFTCDRRCHKKRQCGKHKCAQLCCVDTEHLCDQVCGRKLTCGLHRCEERCHRNNCPTCWQVSFEELRCYCGAEVIYPPVACGTKPPECTRKCTREHTCGHPARHNCHPEDRCPPCTELTQKWCAGRHEIRKNIPCHLVDISCGMPCGQQLPCGVHKCQLVCHKNPCVTGEPCEQPCPKPRAECGHPCGAPCHGDKPCPKVACTTEISLKCDCGNRTEKVQCLMGGPDKSSDFLKMDSAMLALTLANGSDGQGIDISGMMKDASKKKQRKLECNQECSLLERNKRLALALEIKNPDMSSKLGNPTYTQFLKDYARQYTTFVASVEHDLSSLVRTAEKSKQAKRSHAFKAMNSNQRRVVHELADFYGCETQSYDEEPNKNVVATAYRGKCFHPNISLTQMIQRELHPKAPTPISHMAKEHDIRSSVNASKQSTSVLGAWGKLRPNAPGQNPPPPKPNAWASAVSTSAKPKENTTPKASGSSTTSMSGMRLKSMSVLRKDENKSNVAGKTGRSSPVIDYFDMS